MLEMEGLSLLCSIQNHCPVGNTSLLPHPRPLQILSRLPLRYRLLHLSSRITPRLVKLNLRLL